MALVIFTESDYLKSYGRDLSYALVYAAVYRFVRNMVQTCVQTTRGFFLTQRVRVASLTRVRMVSTPCMRSLQFRAYDARLPKALEVLDGRRLSCLATKERPRAGLHCCFSQRRTFGT